MLEFYLPVLKAFFLAILKLTVGCGDMEGGGVGREGGGTLVSTHAGSGTTPFTPGLTGSWSWCVTLALLREAGGNLSLELDTDLSRVSSERLRS